MPITPLQARLALASFLMIAAATAVNMLYLQNPNVVSKSARAQSERTKARAEAERTRRLAIDAVTPSEQIIAAADQPSNTASSAGRLKPVKARNELAVESGIGRFAPAAGALEHASALAFSPEMRMPEIVKGIQILLAQRGYEPGAADGLVGLATRAAIAAYEHDQGLPLTADPTEHLLHHLQGRPSGRNVTPRPVRPARSVHLDMLVRTVQQSLANLGYYGGGVDGLGGEEFVRAIREYEMDQKMVQTGRISAPLINKLAHAATAPRASR